ncbi:MAG: glycosyltransferase [Bacteroidota bacterium]
MNGLSQLGSYVGRRILVAPLNWGLGHATRCVPIIQLLSANNDLIIGSDGAALAWLREEFPDMPYIELPSYGIRYGSQQMWINILRSSPRLIQAIHEESSMIGQVVGAYHIDLVISDHRLGLSTDLCESVVVAHQIHIPHRNNVLASMASVTNRNFLNRFDHVLIPDREEENHRIAGKLSESKGLVSSTYIGPLSRCSIVPTDLDVDVSFVLSGPEPSRQRFEDLCHKVIQSLPASYSVALVRGSSLPNKSSQGLSYCHDLMNSEEINHLLNRSKLVVSRSGYSTIMDLLVLKKKAILIPTPNQPEQEYLAARLGEKGAYSTTTENKMVEELPVLIKSLL